VHVQEKSLNKRIIKKLFTAHPWKLASIYEAGLAGEKTIFNDIQIVFGPMYIYAMFDNKTEKFDYTFLSEKLLKIRIENQNALCRIESANDSQIIIHADYRDAHFIVELKKA